MRPGIQLVLAAAAAATLSTPARAAERVTLTNGFAQVCDHHEVVEGKYRLYTSKETESYIEFPKDQIASIEWVPDPPSEPVAEPVKAAPAPAPARPVQARLTATDLHQMLASAGNAHNVDEDLLASVVKAESNGNVRAVSPKGAQGLMQLMPATAAEQGVQDSFRPEDNVRGGSAYLDWLLKRYNDNLAMALAAYNAGPAAVDKYHGIPPFRETQLYVARVIHEFNRRVKERERLAATARAQASQATAVNRQPAPEHKSSE
jgi:soluble lytic murein transglycosylase-like protein